MKRLEAAAAQKRREDEEEEAERKRRAAQPLLKETAYDRRKVCAERRQQPFWVICTAAVHLQLCQSGDDHACMPLLLQNCLTDSTACLLRKPGSSIRYTPLARYVLPTLCHADSQMSDLPSPPLLLFMRRLLLCTRMIVSVVTWLMLMHCPAF